MRPAPKGKASSPRDVLPEALRDRLPEDFAIAGGGYPDTLLASSAMVGLGLGAADRTFELDAAAVLAGARRYFGAAQLDNGSFPYDPSQRSSGFAKTGAPRTAGAIAALTALGTSKTDETAVRALGYLDAQLAYVSEGHGSSVLGLWFGALACRWHPGPQDGGRWTRYRGMFFPRILAAQRDDGAFECICEGKAFGATNDSRPFAGRAMPGLFQNGTDAYVTVLHLWILLTDREGPRAFDGSPRRSGPTVTPR